jgi:hypothetical protein
MYTCRRCDTMSRCSSAFILKQSLMSLTSCPNFRLALLNVATQRFVSLTGYFHIPLCLAFCLVFKGQIHLRYYLKRISFCFKATRSSYHLSPHDVNTFFD